MFHVERTAEFFSASFAKQYCISYNEYPVAQSLKSCTDYKPFTQAHGMLLA
jgi:hypothetical protein